MAIFPRPVRPTAALADLRAFLSERRPHQWLFAGGAIFLTAMILVGFQIDSHLDDPVWHEPDVIYVKAYAANRTHAEIVAQQQRDLPAELAAKAEQDAWRAERQRQFKKVDQQLDALGF